MQGRIGLLIGHSPMMEEIVREYDNGIIVDGWTAADLMRTLQSITPEDLARVKQGSHRAATDLNSEAEGRAFLQAIGGGRA